MRLHAQQASYDPLLSPEVFLKALGPSSHELLTQQHQQLTHQSIYLLPRVAHLWLRFKYLSC